MSRRSFTLLRNMTCAGTLGAPGEIHLDHHRIGCRRNPFTYHSYLWMEQTWRIKNIAIIYLDAPLCKISSLCLKNASKGKGAVASSFSDLYGVVVRYEF